MKKLLVLIFALGLVFTFTFAGMALDEDHAQVSWTRTWNNVVWINAWKNKGLVPITKADVKAGCKKWGNIARFHVDSATQYMVAMNVIGHAPDNYNIVDDWFDHEHFYSGSKGPDQMFEYRLLAQTKYIDKGRNLADQVMDTRDVDCSGDPTKYDAGKKWHTNVFPIGNVDFSNKETNYTAPELSGFVGVDGNQPVVAAGPSTNHTPGDTFQIDLGLVMAEGDNVASGPYYVNMHLVAMEIIPGDSNMASDIQTAIQ